MQSIKRLPESVHRPLRSSIILFDLPRVIEELIYNSIDAGATKVDVSVNIIASYVKVEDNGCGVARDGLVILGEKYATSKCYPMENVETTAVNLGYRGEALGSLSDVSLVEVRTKARGWPNAYCKIIKGSKCLFLGIDDRREAVGTSVFVRDLFYNQPVRRKCMQSSPKRVLHSVKKCVLRTALVHPLVSFRVTDMESERELLYTVPFTSPLPLVSDGFGNDVSSCLHEMVFSDKILTLTGYISGPADAFSSKAFQYLYINSRFVNKGPIHNMLNSLPTGFQCPVVWKNDGSELQRRKRHKGFGYPAYLLNFHCPMSIYDLNFEPSKTVVEFKDWHIVLSFFEQAITNFWRQLLLQPSQESAADENGVSLKAEELNKGAFVLDYPRHVYTRKKKCNVDLSHISPLENVVDDSISDQNHGMLPKGLPNFSLDRKPSINAEYSDWAVSELPRRTSNMHDHLESLHKEMAFCDNDANQLLKDSYFLLEDHFLSPKYGEDDRVSLKVELTQSVVSENPKSKVTTEGFQSPQACATNLDMLNVEKYHFFENMDCIRVHHSTDHNFGVKFDKLREDYLVYDNVDATNEIYDLETSCLNNNTYLKDVAASEPSCTVMRKCSKNRKTGGISSVCNQTLLSTKSNAQAMQDLLESDRLWESPEKDSSLASSLPPFNVSMHRMLCDYTKTSLERNARSETGFDSLYHGIVEQTGESSRSTCDWSCEDLPVCSKKLELDHDFQADKRELRDFSPFLMVQGAFRHGKFDDDENLLFPGPPDIFSDDCFSKRAFCQMQNHDLVVESPSDEFGLRPVRRLKVELQRSHSAPPFHRGKHRFSILDCCLIAAGGVRDLQFSKISAEAVRSHDDTAKMYASQPYPEPVSSEHCELNFRESPGDKLRASGTLISATCHHEFEHTTAELTKWRSDSVQPAVAELQKNPLESNNDILNISSGLLNLSGSSLVPECMDKDCLEDARVLLQLDGKFIPIVASETLIIIDQHAADERIRLEELRSKVLSGEGCGITYLDSEEELVLPEMSFQLMQRYSEQIQKWGWITNYGGQTSKAFRKNMDLLKRRACFVTLAAVPCILGTNLTSKDLIEFIEQLVETDGSTSLPPAVLRILNYKACRGAIMFGDSLLPTECSLIVEEWKATSLCFQCAHGRPTAVPLVNLASLHEQLERLEMQEALGGSADAWHGLSHHRPSIERAQLRLSDAQRFQSR